jgi:hypothetical protein
VKAESGLCIAWIGRQMLMANLNKSSRIKFLKLGAWLWLIALVMMPLPVAAQALTRVANTSLTFPPQPPRFGYNLVDALPMRLRMSPSNGSTQMSPTEDASSTGRCNCGDDLALYDERL